jgi:glutamyl-tRNA reductase
MKILCIGLNHETAPVAVRERLSLSAAELPAALARIKAAEGVEEAMMLSTCNRVEFYMVAADVGSGKGAVECYLSEALAQDDAASRLERHFYCHVQEEAVAHLYRVVSGMDSMVIGEPQITGQVKDAYRCAVEQETVGTILNRLLHRAFATAKRVRTETELAGRAVSVSYVAVELAKKIFGDLAGRTVMLIGAGEMAELAAKHLSSHGIRQMIVASRTMESARRLAESFSGTAISLEQIAEELPPSDVLICSAAADRYLLGPDDIRAALRARKHRPIFIIDMGVPRNIDPRVDHLENVYLYDMDDLQAVARSNIETRKKELGKAEAIVAEEVKRFFLWLEGLQVVPTIVSLRHCVEEIREQELEKALAALPSLSEDQREVIASMSRAIVNKILHHPTVELKKAEQEGTAEILVEALRRLFPIARSPKDPDR